MDAARETMPTGEDCDVAIVGGGLVGLSLALALAGAGLRVVVVDREAPADAGIDDADGRSSAIAWGSQRVLAAIGAWDLLAADAAAIEDIRVSDGRSRLFLHYDHCEVADHPLGFIVENRFTRRALKACAARARSLRWLAPARVAGFGQRPGARVVELADGRRIAARLLVGCDGKASAVRYAAGIGAFRHRYGQSGIVATLRHGKPHANVAHERFLPAGPFAMLPLPDRDGAHRSSIVWTEREALVPALMALGADEFAAEARRRFGDWLGALSLEGRRFAYPLEIVQADSLVASRVALAGDAAHAIHPIAGQGFNLGLRDVAALAECVVDAARLGLDIGGGEVLERYQRWRRVDNMSLLAVTDVLNRLFSNDLPPLRAARRLGLAAVERVPPLKRLFMRHAMGVVGDLPRLVRGEGL
ncbi:MAG: FAD-dependent oxidoreductase [Alphaproteobacteria bacterium]|nr:FAD-dependent oxidoreductase [Alphaproteobacteria bacterium]